MVALSREPRKLGMVAFWARPLNVPTTGSPLPSLFTIVNDSPPTGTYEPLRTSETLVRLTAPTTFSWLYWVSTVVPLIAIARSLAKDRVLAVTSVNDLVGFTAAGDVPG